MMETLKNIQKIGLTGSQLKWVALITMTIDHIGMVLFPRVLFLRIIGRLAYPIYAYMITQGCLHTRNMKRYFLTILSLAAVFQVVYFVAMDSLYQGVLVTFSLSIGLIMLLKKAEEKKTAGLRLASIVTVFATLFVTELLPLIWSGTDFGVDYGFLGVLLPVCVYVAGSRTKQFWMAAGMLVLMGLKMGSVQWYCLLALPLLYLYNGKRGSGSKYLFYIYYPAHLVVIWLIQMLLF